MWVLTNEHVGKSLWREWLPTRVHFLWVSRNLTAAVADHRPQTAELLDQTLARDAEDARRTALVAGGETQHFTDVLGLDLRERGKLERVVRHHRGRERGASGEELLRQVLRHQLLAFLEQHH